MRDDACLPYFRCGEAGPLSGRETSKQDEALCTKEQLGAAVAKELERAPADVVAMTNGTRPQLFTFTDDISTGVAAAAVAAADRLKDAVLVAFTESGYTARLISELRPRVRLLALTPHLHVVRRMALYWGVTARTVGRFQSTEAMVRQVRRLLLADKLARPGSPIVIVAGVPLNQPGFTNLITVHRL